MKEDTLRTRHVPNILIVDDIGANLKLIADILKPEGYRTRPVPDGMLALLAAEKEKPDLILLDIMMPGMDGFEVCRRLKENPVLKEIPVIFISGMNDTSDIVNAFTAGGVDYINKPFREEEVIARVRTHLNVYQQKKELQELNATKDKFFSIIAHDLRGPFSGFFGLTKLMADESESLTSEEIHHFSVTMRNSASNMFKLLENLLEWARLQQGLITCQPEAIQLHAIADEIMSGMQEQAEKKLIELINNVPSGIDVFADYNMLQTVIRNLVSNAVKFTPKGGKISVSAKIADAETVEISIRDTGIGMNRALVDNLFKLDNQTGRKGTEGEPTTGLGLILCKEFVEKHGKKIWVESEEGRGTIFYFTMSRNVKPGQQSDVTHVISTEGRGVQLKDLKILVAEDDMPSELIIIRTLKKISREFLVAKTGVEAVKFCCNHPDIDLIIMDIQMAEMDGHEAIRQIREFNKEVVIIVQTADVSSHDREKAMNEGCNGYLSKPLEPDLLMRLLRKQFNG